MAPTFLCFTNNFPLHFCIVAAFFLLHLFFSAIVALAITLRSLLSHTQSNDFFLMWSWCTFLRCIRLFLSLKSFFFFARASKSKYLRLFAIFFSLLLFCSTQSRVSGDKGPGKKANELNRCCGKRHTHAHKRRPAENENETATRNCPHIFDQETKKKKV